MDLISSILFVQNLPSLISHAITLDNGIVHAHILCYCKPLCGIGILLHSADVGFQFLQ